MGNFFSSVFRNVRLLFMRPLLFFYFRFKFLKERKTLMEEELPSNHKMWNSWGNEADFKSSKPLPEDADKFLKEYVGHAKPWKPASFETVCALVPKSRISTIPSEFAQLLDVSPSTRVKHSRGQSCPDWLSFKSGQIDSFPDAVAFPRNEKDVREVIKFCKKEEIKIIAYGGGTSVLGHINPPVESSSPIMTVNMRKMNKVVCIDEENHLARFGAGATTPEVRKHLAQRGYFWGHRPQCFDYATLGGYVACRSSGQESLGYGRIGDLIRGVKMETAQGQMVTGKFPVSAAGPDVEQLVLGSEGRAGIITEVTLKITRVPSLECYSSAIFPSWKSALQCCKELVSKFKHGCEFPLTMLRVSNATETQTNLRLSLSETKLKILENYLQDSGCPRDEMVMLVYGLAGSRRTVRRGNRRLKKILRKYSAVTTLGEYLGLKWRQARFSGPYKREHLFARGYALDTVETCTRWSNLEDLTEKMEKCLVDGLRDEKEKVLAFSHCSHFYQDGSCIYTTYIFRLANSYEETKRRWKKLKHAVSTVIVENGGTISDHHGVGKDHVEYLQREVGEEGMKMLRAPFERIDPTNMFNPETLFVKKRNVPNVVGE